MRGRGGQVEGARGEREGQGEGVRGREGGRTFAEMSRLDCTLCDLKT